MPTKKSTKVTRKSSVTKKTSKQKIKYAVAPGKNSQSHPLYLKPGYINGKLNRIGFNRQKIDEATNSIDQYRSNMEKETAELKKKIADIEKPYLENIQIQEDNRSIYRSNMDEDGTSVRDALATFKSVVVEKKARFYPLIETVSSFFQKQKVSDAYITLVRLNGKITWQCHKIADKKSTAKKGRVSQGIEIPRKFTREYFGVDFDYEISFEVKILDKKSTKAYELKSIHVRVNEMEISRRS